MTSELEEYLRDKEVSDPSSFTKVLAYLDDIDIEDEEFVETLVRRVSTETIYWEQPWYQKGALTRQVKVDDAENHEEMFLTDLITIGEGEKIHKNWEKFRKKYKMPDTLICFSRWKSKNKGRNPNRSPEEAARRFLTAFLARGLQRTLHSVFKYLLKLCSENTNRTYSEFEEKIIEICVYHDHKTAVTNAAKLLHREPRGIHKKMFQILNGKPERKRLRWTLELATKFVNSLIKYSGVESLDDLKYKKIEKSVWLKLEKDFDQLYIYLQCFWTSTMHVQLFVKREVILNKLRRKMFKRFKKSSIRVWSDLRWKELVKSCPDGFTHMFLYATLYSVVRNIENYLRRPLPEIATIALARIKKHPTYRLRTLVLEDGKLKEIKYTE